MSAPNAHLLGVQAFGAFIVMVYSFVVTLIIGFALEKTIGFRVNQESEVSGVDIAEHLETAYETSRGVKL